MSNDLPEDSYFDFKYAKPSLRRILDDVVQAELKRLWPDIRKACVDLHLRRQSPEVIESPEAPVCIPLMVDKSQCSRRLGTLKLEISLPFLLDNYRFRIVESTEEGGSHQEPINILIASTVMPRVQLGLSLSELGLDPCELGP